MVKLACILAVFGCLPLYARQAGPQFCVKVSWPHREPQSCSRRPVQKKKKKKKVARKYVVARAKEEEAKRARIAKAIIRAKSASQPPLPPEKNMFLQWKKRRSRTKASSKDERQSRALTRILAKHVGKRQPDVEDED